MASPGILTVKRVTPEPSTYILLGPDARGLYNVRRDPEGWIVLHESTFYEAKDFVKIMNSIVSSPLLECEDGEAVAIAGVLRDIIAADLVAEELGIKRGCRDAIVR